MAEEIKELKIGMKAYMHKTVTEYDVYAFAGLTGDFSRVHVDKEFAEKYRFGQRIAHGLIAASYPSTVMGTQLPGSGTLFLDQQCQFLKPTYFGDTISCEVEFTSFVEKRSCYIGEFKGTCTNQRGEVVVAGTYHQMLPKTYFKVTE